MKRLAVFARAPEPGRVKTRLSPALPPDLACDLYRAMLRDTFEATTEAHADERYVYWAEQKSSVSAPTDGLQVRVQQGADLGARLDHAFGELLRALDDRVVIMGADCPGLDAAALRSAFEALESRDLVLGPTRDGGYYLVGLRRPAPQIFRGIAWSTEQVLDQTLERARDAKLTIAALDELEDLDTPEALVRWLGQAAWEPGPGRHTEEALRAMGLLPTAASQR
jgi:uncharacterized protein